MSCIVFIVSVHVDMETSHTKYQKCIEECYRCEISLAGALPGPDTSFAPGHLSARVPVPSKTVPKKVGQTARGLLGGIKGGA